MPSTSNSVHFFMNLYLQIMHINYRNQERQSFSSLIPHREAFIDVIDLFSAPVTHSCFAQVFFLKNFEQTTKFQLNLAEDFQSNRKGLFHSSINGKKEKPEQHCKKSIGVLIAHTQLKGGCGGGRRGSMFLHPILLTQFITGMSPSRGMCLRVLAFCYFLQYLEEKHSLKQRKWFVCQQECTRLPGASKGRWR